MPQKISQNPADYIVPLNMNGLEGRMLHVPVSNQRKREILLIYGHHAMLERWWGLVQNLNQYGAVTMPDLPGFGGMDSFAQLGRRPDLDAFADYLAAFIKLRFRRKTITIVAISFGFLVVTRMLQRYPELTKKVVLLVSIVGFVHKDDFVYTPLRRTLFRGVTRMFATRPSAFFIRYFLLNRFILRNLYTRLPNSKRRMIEITAAEFDASMELEYTMWRANDVRTHWLTTNEFLNVDNCGKKIALPVAHVISSQDHYFRNEIVEQHMLVVFQGYSQFVAQSKAHTPSILADKKASGVLLPPGVRRMLAKS